MNARETAADLDQHARACWREAEIRLSRRTVAELNRRRVAAINGADRVHHGMGHWFASPWMATACASACAIAISLGLLWPRALPPSPSASMTAAVLEIADAFDPADAMNALDELDVFDAINLTELDEDSEFFVWFATHEASLLAME